MAVQTKRNVTALQLGKTEGSLFPLISHISPIWPQEKRIERGKSRKVTRWRLVRNKMIIVRFLQSINPALTDLFSNVVDEEEKGTNIVTLTRNFQEEQRKKQKRVHEIQMEAYLRAEKTKSNWEKVRENQCTADLRITRESLATKKRNSMTNLTNQSLRLTSTDQATIKYCSSRTRQVDIHLLGNKDSDTSAKSRQRKSNSQTFKSLKEEFSSPRDTDVTSLPPIYRGSSCAIRPTNDPRFQRLLLSLIPPMNKTNFSIRSDITRNKATVETEITVSKGGLTENRNKRKETMVPIYNDKNSTHRNKTKLTRPVAGLWYSA